MILTRTPFRLPLGGGSTDLPSYYEKYGGFIFSVTINLYMYVGVNRPPIDEKIRIKYRESEETDHISDIKHNLARAALLRTNIIKMVEISSMADVPDGTGLGSSASYLVGLLNALHTQNGDNMSRRQLAEEAFEIANQDLGLPDGKQDFYMASFGNFCVLNIDRNGRVVFSAANISPETQKKFESQTLLFYTGIKRSSTQLLQEQRIKIQNNETRAIELKHETKRIGMDILTTFENGDLDAFGKLLDAHWEIKKQMSKNISISFIDDIYQKVKSAGALGGKIVGAGGGGFFLVYCKAGTQEAVRSILRERGLREIEYKVDAGGTQVLINYSRSRNTI